MTNNYNYAHEYPFFVEYIDEFGITRCESWSERTLDEELRLGTVKILHIELAYDLQVELGMISE